MTFSKDEEEILHRALARVLEEEGYGNICSTALPDYENPDPIYWAQTEKEIVPDLEAVKEGVKFLFDIETEKTIDRSETEGPLKLLSAYAGQNGHRLCLVVPTDRELAAETLLKKLHIENAMIFTV